MNIERRHMSLPILALGMLAVMPVLAPPALAATNDEAAVAKNTEAHRAALAASDAKALGRLCAPELSYSHSDGHVEDKATFIANATSGKSKWLSLAYEGTTVRVVGDVAIVRFRFVGDSQAGDKTNHNNLAVLMVWQRQHGTWMLLARSATKL
jgi:ketosteroid isomerase-like protein